MKTVKLRVIEGYGTRDSPYIGGTEKLVEVPADFEKNQHVRALVVSEEFDEVAGQYEVPVIPYEFINHLVGMLKTQADAAMSDKTQREAFKDLLQQTVWRWYEGQGRPGLN